MRARNIKPGFFKNEDLAECDPLARILYAGLWCMADREGRMEFRPKRIKAEALPYDECNIDDLLSQLHKSGFVLIYQVNGEKYLSIVKFAKHQNCHVREADSTIPAPDEHSTCTVQAPSWHGSSPAESPILNPERGKGASTSPSSPPKNKFLDSVYLTEVEHNKLQEVLGQKSLEVGIEKLDYSITVKSGKYKDHYKTLLNWFKRGYLVEGGNGNGFTRGPGPTVKKAGRAASDGMPYPVDHEF